MLPAQVLADVVEPFRHFTTSPERAEQPLRVERLPDRVVDTGTHWRWRGGPRREAQGHAILEPTAPEETAQRAPVQEMPFLPQQAVKRVRTVSDLSRFLRTKPQFPHASPPDELNLCAP